MFLFKSFQLLLIFIIFFVCTDRHLIFNMYSHESLSSAKISSVLNNIIVVLSVLENYLLNAYFFITFSQIFQEYVASTKAYVTNYYRILKKLDMMKK